MGTSLVLSEDSSFGLRTWLAYSELHARKYCLTGTHGGGLIGGC